jgi:hypothetical protein
MPIWDVTVTLSTQGERQSEARGQGHVPQIYVFDAALQTLSFVVLKITLRNFVVQ